MGVHYHGDLPFRKSLAIRWAERRMARMADMPVEGREARHICVLVYT